jgi:hypothetical protein
VRKAAVYASETLGRMLSDQFPRGSVVEVGDRREVPSSSSNCLICRLNGGCAMCDAAAA